MFPQADIPVVQLSLDRTRELAFHYALGKDLTAAGQGCLDHWEWDHFLPLLYTLALQDQKDTVEFFADPVTFGSISMRSFEVG